MSTKDGGSYLRRCSRKGCRAFSLWQPGEVCELCKLPLRGRLPVEPPKLTVVRGGR